LCVFYKSSKKMSNVESVIQISKKLGSILKVQRKTLGVAESCTGGLLCKTVTDVPGSSSYFLGGVVSYSNTVKEGILKIDRDSLMNFGAVSEVVALKMARGAKNVVDADVAIAITGVAGPEGGSKDKPVGTVYIAWDTRAVLEAKRYDFGGLDRRKIQGLSVFSAIVGLIERLQTP